MTCKDELLTSLWKIAIKQAADIENYQQSDKNDWSDSNTLSGMLNHLGQIINTIEVIGQKCQALK